MICHSFKISSAPIIIPEVDPIIIPEVELIKNKSDLHQKCFLWLMGAFLPLLLSSGCTKRAYQTPSSIQKDISIEKLLSLYQERLRGINGLKALIEVTANFSGRGHHTFQASLHAQNNLTRIRGFDLFGGTLFDLRLNDRFFSLKLPSEKILIEDALEQFESIADQKMPFGSLDLLEWLKRGGIPEPTLRDIPALEKGKHFFILYLFAIDQGMARIQQKIYIERTAFRVKKVELFDPSGLRRGMMKFDDYRKVDGRDFPFVVQGSGLGEGISMTFREVSFTGPVSRGSQNENPGH